jgi:mannose-6-phosphate isomerase-like protein (cupin superfamily)
MKRMLIGLALSLAGAATIGLQAAARTAVPTYLAAADVAAAFATGRPLLEVDGFKVHASRRETAGTAEVHVRDTDVIYVLEGSATIVTGGTVVSPRTVAADELRGTHIDGGQPRALAKGDVFVVPNGVPHWFKTVEAPLLYYVVKVTAADGGTR